MKCWVLFWWMLFVSSVAMAVPFSVVNEKTSFDVLCDHINKQNSTELFYIDTEVIPVGVYDNEHSSLSISLGTSLTFSSYHTTLLYAETKLETNISPEPAKQIQSLASSGKLLYRVAFQVDTSMKGACIFTTTNGTNEYQIYIKPLIVEVLRRSTKRPLLRYETAEYKKIISDESLDIEITTPTLLQGTLATEKIATELEKQKQTLKRCYAAGLARNQKSQGTLTLQFYVEQKSEKNSIDVTIDTLNNDEIEECVTENLSKMLVPVEIEKTSSFCVTLYFLQKK